MPEDQVNPLEAMNDGAPGALAPAATIRARGDRRRRQQRAATAGAFVMVLAVAVPVAASLEPDADQDSLKFAKPSPSATASATASAPALPSPSAEPSTRPSATASTRASATAVPTPQRSSAPPTPRRTSGAPAPVAPTPRSTPSPDPTPVPGAGGGGGGGGGGGTSTARPKPATPAPTTRALTPASRIQLAGIGGLTAGMTYAELERAVGAPVKVQNFEGSVACTYVSIPSLPESQRIAMLGGKGTVRSFEVTSGRTTQSRIGIGDTKAEVRRVYSGLTEASDPYSAEPLLVRHPKGSPYQLVFGFLDGKVQFIRSGFVAETLYPEGCA